MTYDTVSRNVSIADGGGKTSFIGNIAISGDTISLMALAGSRRSGYEQQWNDADRGQCEYDDSQCLGMACNEKLMIASK